MRIALGIEYDGSQYYGWQSQSDHASIQKKVEQALSIVADHPVQIICAGRTDRGVHATAQVVHFLCHHTRSQQAWILGGNSNLPADIRITWAKPVDDTFHARFSAIRRRYCFLISDSIVRPAILRHGITWYCGQLNLAVMQQASQYFIGEHDFSSVRAAQCQSKTTIREIYHLNVSRVKRLIMIDIMANAFLHHMVRNIVGVLMMIGAGKQPPEWAAAVLQAKDRRQAGITAPEQGLYLIHVGYPEYFEIPQAVVFPLFL
jgi:tRNA pseudouridine38-40 synthase